MIEKLIVWLLRLKLGVEKFEPFIFANQKNMDQIYYFSDNALVKAIIDKRQPLDWNKWDLKLSKVSLNWLLSDECKAVKVGDPDDSVRR